MRVSQWSSVTARKYYVYEGGTELYLHTGNIRASLFHDNIQGNPRVCLEVSGRCYIGGTTNQMKQNPRIENDELISKEHFIKGKVRFTWNLWIRLHWLCKIITLTTFPIATAAED